jgi:beta-galactosidase beta subunit
MIVCCQHERNAFHPIINKGIEFTSQTNFSTLTPGKHDIIPEEMFFLLQEMNTLSANGMRAESHFNFVDITAIPIARRSFVKLSLKYI